MKKHLLFIFVVCFIASSHAQYFNKVLKAVEANQEIGDRYGYSVSISGNYAIIGAPGKGTTGAAYIFERDGSGNWTEVQKLLASDRAMTDWFGYSVSISGNYAIVGAYLEDEDVAGTNTMSKAGSAYIFERDGGGNWNQAKKLVASDRGSGDNFGISVSISGDYAVVGANLEKEDAAGLNTLLTSGSAYVFERDGGGSWKEVQKLVASKRYTWTVFASSVSISGNTIIIGAPQAAGDTLNPTAFAGTVYVFERDGGGNWNEVQQLAASDQSEQAQFGFSISISGNNAIIGAIGESKNTIGTDSLFRAGAAYVFKRDGSGSWSETQKLVASDRDSQDFFGRSVSISSNYAIIGAPQNSKDTMGAAHVSAAGSAYVFKRDGSDNWTEVQKLVATNREAGDFFAFSVSVSGNYAIVGRYSEDVGFMNDVGSANIYETISTVGVNELENNTGLHIYPNPNKGVFTVQLDKPNNEPTTLTIHNIVGELITTQIITVNQTTIDLSSYKKGVYFIKMTYQAKTLTQKIITR